MRRGRCGIRQALGYRFLIGLSVILIYIQCFDLFIVAYRLCSLLESVGPIGLRADSMVMPMCHLIRQGQLNRPYFHSKLDPCAIANSKRTSIPRRRQALHAEDGCWATFKTCVLKDQRRSNGLAREEFSLGQGKLTFPLFFSLSLFSDITRPLQAYSSLSIINPSSSNSLRRTHFSPHPFVCVQILQTRVCEFLHILDPKMHNFMRLDQSLH